MTPHQQSLYLELYFLPNRALWFCGFMDLQQASIGLNRRFYLEVNMLSTDLSVACFERLNVNFPLENSIVVLTYLHYCGFLNNFTVCLPSQISVNSPLKQFIIHTCRWCHTLSGLLLYPHISFYYKSEVTFCLFIFLNQTLATH